MKKGIWILLFVLVAISLVAECARMNTRQRQNGVRKETRSKTAKTRIRIAPQKQKTSRTRGEVFENLVNVYDPSFLSVVWPKINNGVHLFVNRACWQDLSVFFRDLSDGRAWAFNVVDASGRYQSGLFEGNRLWLGSKTKCYQLDKQYVTKDINQTMDDMRHRDHLNTVIRREKYFDGEEWRSLVARDELMRRLVSAENAPPHHVAYTAVSLRLNVTKLTMTQSHDITLGVCLPRSCTSDDIAALINFSIMLNDNFKANRTVPRTIELTSLRPVVDSYDITTDTAAIALVLITLVLLTLAITATIVDFKLINCSRNRKSMSFDLQKFNNSTLDAERRAFDEEKRLNPDTYFSRKSNVVDTETLTINNINNSNNINLVTVKKVMKPNTMPPSITLDVVSMDRVSGSCRRCGKYKKQCNSNIQQPANMQACPRIKSFASLTEQKKDSLFKTLLLCFSLRYSWKRIFNTNMTNKDLSAMHVLRIMATFWIIFMHVAMIASYVSEDSGNVNEYSNGFYIVVTGTLAFDTLFFVSGVFSVHHYFFLKSRYTVEQLVSFGGACGQLMQFVCFVSNRAIRLLPSYAYAILLSWTLGGASWRTAAVTAPGPDHHNCRLYWWRNLLYVTTLFPEQEQCMQVSWYLSVETQLHLAVAGWCALARGGRAAGLLALAPALAAAAADTAGHYASPARFSDVFALYSWWVVRPLARVAPYAAGALAAAAIHHLEGRVHVSKFRSIVLWCVSLCACAVCMCVSTHVTWWSSGVHVLWAAALVWPTIVLATNLAGVSRPLTSSALVSALSRLSCSALLVHGALARYALLRADNALCYHYMCMWFYFCGVSALTVLAALCLSLLVETPCCSLLRRLSDYAA